MKQLNDRLLKRFTILKKLDYYIEESVYYRTNNEDMRPQNRKPIWLFGEESGKINIYEDTITGK